MKLRQAKKILFSQKRRRHRAAGPRPAVAMSEKGPVIIGTALLKTEKEKKAARRMARYFKNDGLKND